MDTRRSSQRPAGSVVQHTVPSPLSSGAYIRLTGTSHFHRYYGAIRLPTTLLFPSFRCVHIPRFTRFRGRCRLSPVDKIALYSMDRSQTPPWHPQARPYRPFLCCLPRFPLGRPTVLLSFDAQYCSCCLPRHASHTSLPPSAQVRCWLLGYYLSRPDFHRLAISPFAGRTGSLRSLLIH